MKKLLLILLFVPLVSFGQETQQKNNEFDELKQTPLTSLFNSKRLNLRISI